jgi:Archaeal holliday junction resolvase (hjc)
MSLHRRNPRRDASEADIVDTLEACGWSVTRLSIAGGPDLLAGRRGETLLVEVKSSTGTLSEAQTVWHLNWRGAPVAIFRNGDDAVAYSLGQYSAPPPPARRRRPSTGRAEKVGER